MPFRTDRTLFACLGAFLGAAATIATVTAPAHAETLRLAHCCALGSHFDVGAKKFRELLEEKTGGKMKVQVFPGGQLGQETEVIQNVQAGTIALTMIGHDPLAQFDPMTTILSMPYLFTDRDQAFRLLDGKLGEKLDEGLAKKGLHVLGWGDNGVRVYTNNQRPIKVPSDLNGLKIRSPENPVNLAITKALGGIPVAMPYGDVYTAIQQNTIDGQENAAINIYPARLYEVQKYLSLTNHLRSFTVLLMSESVFDNLSPDLQKAVMSAGEEAMAFQREYAQKLSDELLAKMEQEGVKVNQPDLAPFKEATSGVLDKYVGKSFGKELYQLVAK